MGGYGYGESTCAEAQKAAPPQKKRFLHSTETECEQEKRSVHLYGTLDCACQAGLLGHCPPALGRREPHVPFPLPPHACRLLTSAAHTATLVILQQLGRAQALLGGGLPTLLLEPNASGFVLGKGSQVLRVAAIHLAGDQKADGQEHRREERRRQVKSGPRGDQEGAAAYL